MSYWSNGGTIYIPGTAQQSVGRICLREVGKEQPGSLQVKGLTKDLSACFLEVLFSHCLVNLVEKEAKCFQSTACFVSCEGFGFCWTLLAKDAKDTDDTGSWSC